MTNGDFDSGDVVFLLTAYTICRAVGVSPCSNIPDKARLLASVCTCVTAATGSYMRTTGSLHKISRNAVKAFSCDSDHTNGRYVLTR